MSTYTTPPSVNGDGSESDTRATIVTETTPPKEQDRAGAPKEKERARNEWMMIAIGLTALMSILATIIAVVALASKSSPPTTTVVQATPAAPKTLLPVLKPEALKISIKADDEHGRLGPDGKWHDAFLPADFTVQAGRTVTITFYNYDGGQHTFTSPAMGLNVTIPAGAAGAPHKVTFTFKAPAKPGRYAWWCALPCDPWAMAHDGYMRGFVNVKA